MAHNIERRDNQFGIEMGWHGLTKIVPVVKREEVYPWTVEFVPLHRGDTQEQFGRWVLPIASDDREPLGFANPINLATYTPECPHQNWEFLESVLKDTEYEIASAGTVQNRSKFFISARLNQLQKIAIADGSEIELYFNAMGSLDKSLNKKIAVSGTRIVCYNTLMMDFLADQTVESLRKQFGEKLFPWVKEGDKKTKLAWKFRHSKNMESAVAKEFSSMEQAAGYSAIVKAMFDGLVERPCNENRAERIYAGFLFGGKRETGAKIETRARNILDEHISAFRGEGKDSGNAGKTEFDLLNGLTQPLTRGYSQSDRNSWDVYETAEFGVYSARKSEFARILTFDRDELTEVEKTGKELLTN